MVAIEIHYSDLPLREITARRGVGSWVGVAFCNSCYMEDRDRRIANSRPVWAKLLRSCLKNKIKIKRLET
jgi:hypothetical protein